MPFNSSDDLYEVLGGFLQEGIVVPLFRDLLLDAGGGIRMTFTEPTAVIDLLLDESEPEIVFGGGSTEPATTMTMSGDVAQQLFTSQATFVGAMDRGDLVTSADIPRLADLVAPIVLVAAPIYVEDLTEMGRADLL